MKEGIFNLFRFPEREVVLSTNLRQVVANRLVLLTMVLVLLYYIIDHVINTNVTHIMFLSMLISCAVVLFISICGYFKLAKIIGLLLYNFIVYNICASQNYTTGVHLHLITGAVIAMIIFGYEERSWGITYALVSFLAFALSFFYRVSIFPVREFDLLQRNIFFIINLLVFAAMNLYLIFLILRVNHRVEFALHEKNLELNQANVELDRFVYSASHDLRAPLNSISGLFSLLRTDPNSSSYYDMIQGRIAVMSKFISDLTDYSRNARATLKKEEINIFPLIKEIVDTFDGYEPNRRIQFLIDVNEDLKVFSEPLRLRIILNNLISNAVKYTDNSKLNSYVNIKGWLQSGNINISITDNGIGIDSALQPRIFEMFFRATNSAVGSGLGLFIVKESIQKIDGTIIFKSELGVGTTFQITIPHPD